MDEDGKHKKGKRRARELKGKYKPQIYMDLYNRA